MNKTSQERQVGFEHAFKIVKSYWKCTLKENRQKYIGKVIYN